MRNEELQKLDLDGFPLSNEFLLELGRVAALWASLESFLNICLGKLAGFSEDDPRWFILVNHSSFQQRLEMLGALSENLVVSHPSLVGYEKVIGVLKSAQAVRNRYMHHGLALNPVTGKIEMAIGSARGKLKVSVEPIEPVDIRRAAIQIHEAMRDLYRLVLRKSIPSVADVAEQRKKKR